VVVHELTAGIWRWIHVILAGGHIKHHDRALICGRPRI